MNITFNSQNNYSQQFLESALLGDFSRLQLLLKRKSEGEIDFDIEATENRSAVLENGARRYHLSVIPKGMNALHFACLIGHEDMIKHLITHAPSLLEKRCKVWKYTPLLTLNQNIGAVRVISDECFRTFLNSGAFLDAFDGLFNNAFLYLSEKPRDGGKLKMALTMFKHTDEEFKNELSSALPRMPTVLIDIIMGYGNLYSKNLLSYLLNFGTTRTVWQNACTEARSQFIDAGVTESNPMLNK